METLIVGGDGEEERVPFMLLATIWMEQLSQAWQFVFCGQTRPMALA